MKRLTLMTMLVAAAVVLAGCGGDGGPNSVPNDAVAVVGDRTIDKSEFDAIVAQAKRTYEKQKRPFPSPGSPQFSQLRGQIMAFLVERAEYEDKAEDLGIEVTNDDVDKRLEQLKKQYFVNPPGQKAATKEEIEKRYRQQLASQGLTEKEVREGLRAQLIREEVFKKVTKDVKASDDDVKEYYDKHKSQYEQPAQPESRDVRHILVKTRAQAMRIYNQLKAHPARFGQLAQKFSIDTQTKPLGGRLPGGAFRGRTVKPFDRVAFSLKVKQISQPVKTQFGWHIIQALGPIRPPQKAKATPFDQVKDAIRQQLIQQKKQTEMDDWWKKSKKDLEKKIKYRAGYAPPSTSTTSTTKG
jgi:parvulin-like peptidyl-prolyl isomerase